MSFLGFFGTKVTTKIKITNQNQFNANHTTNEIFYSFSIRTGRD